MRASRRTLILGMSLCGLLVGGSSTPVSAQGLLWKLPSDVNFSIEYYGTFTQKDISAGVAGAAPKPIVWQREIIVKSLKQEQGYYNGQAVKCRWIEISVRTGELFEGDIDTGPAGKRVYKVLVPQSKVVNSTVDSDKIFVSMIPIARDKDGKIMGVKKIGNSKAKRITSPVLQVYPILTLLQHYRSLKPVPAVEAITIAKQQVSSDNYKKFTASRVIESRSSRSESTATLYFVDNPQLVPTRLAKWKVIVVHKSKDASQNRDSAFKPTIEFTVEMTARTVTRGNVTSDLPDPKDL